MIKERYSGNLGAFSEAELAEIGRKSVCVIGCGGLGGYVCNALARFGVGKITVADGDVFCESNLNRQLFARMGTLGQNKAEVCARELAEINPDVAVTPVREMLTGENAEQILQGHDVVIDCLDNLEARLLLEERCEKLGLTLIHGAINGFMGQAAVISPGDRLLKRLYAGWKPQDVKSVKKRGNPVFSPQLVAAIQCGEALKLLAGRAPQKRGLLLHVNLEELEFNLIDN